jgi:hypothetical protein
MFPSPESATTAIGKAYIYKSLEKKNKGRSIKIKEKTVYGGFFISRRAAYIECLGYIAGYP